MLTIYGADLSPPSFKVRFAANALALTYEYKKVDLINGENTSEDFLKLNPAGKVPVIQDDGFVLYESNAILKYLAATSESPLYPAGIKQRALIDQWMDFVSHHVATAMNRVWLFVLSAMFSTSSGKSLALAAKPGTMAASLDTPLRSCASEVPLLGVVIMATSWSESRKPSH